MHDGVIKIRIAAPAVENAANEARLILWRRHSEFRSGLCGSFQEGPADESCWQLMA
jgi:hypothetical protein